MKRVFAILLVLVVAVAFVYAAGASETAAPKADEPITLRYWTHEDANIQAF